MVNAGNKGQFESNLIFLPLEKSTFQKGTVLQKVQRKVTKVVSILQNGGYREVYPIPLSVTKSCS